MNGQNRSQIPPGMLLRVIQSKHEIIARYNALSALASGRQSSIILTDIMEDETAHLNMFNTLYINLFGEIPAVEDSAPPVIGTFIEGVKTSILSELNEYNSYCTIIISDSNDDVRRVFMRALFDENRHAASLNFLLMQLTISG